MRDMRPEPSVDSSSTSHSALLNDRVLQLAVDFNLFPALYVHESWRAALGPVAIDDALAREPLWTRALSTSLLRLEQLDQHFDFDFAERAKRLALLDAATLRKLLSFAAGMQVRERLRLVVSARDVQVLQQMLGADNHRLILEWNGPMLPPTTDDWRRDWPDADGCALRGLPLLCAVIPDAAPGVIGRLRLKLPAHWPRAAFRARASDAAHRSRTTAVLIQAVSHIAPAWDWLFADAASATGSVAA